MENQHSPFDCSAADRLRRMGLATAAGSVDRDAMAVFCCIFAGQFFDDLHGYYQDREDAKEILTHMLDEAEYAEPKKKFLLICLQYDAIYCDLPDPVWWLSGNPEFVESFAEGFLAHLKRLDENETT